MATQKKTASVAADIIRHNFLINWYDISHKHLISS